MIAKAHFRSKIILCLAINLIFFNGWAQQYEWLSNNFPGSRFIDVYEHNGKIYGVVSNGAMFFYNPLATYQISIYEMEFENLGEPSFLLHEITSVSFPENYATLVADFIEDSGLWLLVQSAVISDGYQRYRVILCDELFNIIEEQTLDTLGYPIQFHIDNFNGKTHVLGSIIGPPRDELFYYEYHHDNPFQLDEIQITQSEPTPMFWVTSMNVDERTRNLLIFYFNGIAVLDTTLYQVEKFDHTSHISTSDHGSLLGVGSNYYSHGSLRQSWQTGLRWQVFQKYDTLFNILGTDTFGITGRDNYPFISKSLDYSSGQLLMGGHLDGPLTHFNFDEVNKEFYLAKYDLEMNQLWYKEYGGDRPYVLYGLKLLDDGSSLAFGSIKDSIDQQNYAYIMHVDENGDILSSSSIPSKPVLIQIVNPGYKSLQIINRESISAQIVLYDINGRLVLSSEITPATTEISTIGIPAGIFPYAIIKDGKQIGSGKWVKVQ